MEFRQKDGMFDMTKRVCSMCGSDEIICIDVCECCECGCVMTPDDNILDFAIKYDERKSKPKGRLKELIDNRIERYLNAKVI